MSHTGPFDGELQYRQTTGQKQQSGGCNLGAVANATLEEPSPPTQLQHRMDSVLTTDKENPMGEWSDYFEDFPEENPANWVNGKFNPR